MSSSPPDLSQILPQQQMPDLGPVSTPTPNLAGSPGSPQYAAAQNKPPTPTPILAQLIAGLIHPQMRASAPGQEARPVSRLDTFESFLGNFVNALGQGMAAAHGPGAFGKGVGAAVTAPYQQAVGQFQLGQEAQANQAEIQQRTAHAGLEQAQAKNLGSMVTLPNGMMVPMALAQKIMPALFSAQGRVDAAKVTGESRENVADTQATSSSQRQADSLKSRWDQQTRDLQTKMQMEQMRQSGANARAAGKQQNQLTSSTRTMIEMAPTVKNRVADIRTLLNDPELRAQLGPGGSRWSEMWAGKIGASDPKFTQLRSQAMLLQTALMRMHVGARGSKDMMDHFRGIIDTGKQSPENMEAALGVIDQYAGEKIQEGRYGMQGPPTPTQTSAPSGTSSALPSLIKKYAR